MQSHDDEDEWRDDGDELGMIDCPNCREEVYEETERCPHCGHYLTQEEDTPGRQPWWIIVGAVACLAVALGWIFGR
jgi:hypothetical protein